MTERDEQIAELELCLGLKQGFFDALLHEDDWSFVIKLHALIEAATTHLLVEHFDDARLLDVFSHLELSGPRTGKVAFLKSIDCLSKDLRRYIVSLSELRNMLVHDVSKIEFSFESLKENYSEKEYREFVKRFAGLFGENLLDGSSGLSLLKNDPKELVWSGAMGLLFFISNRKSTSKMERYMKADRLLRSYEI